MEQFLSFAEKAAPLIVGIIGLVTGIWGTVSKRRRDNADIMNTVNVLAQGWIDKLKTQVAEHEERIEGQQEQITMLARKVGRYEKQLTTILEGARRLMRQVELLGHTPVWFVPEELEEIQEENVDA